MATIRKCRIIAYKGATYIHSEDVTAMITSVADNEPTDTQRVLDDLCKNITEAAQKTLAKTKT